ncbi:MAG: hypothetical protein JW973_16285 [Bacteroidales bacterium]|nr:hypothetical protein [Bacteroidales bacterium]
MNKRLFFLKSDGWFEAKIAGKILNAPADELIRYAYGIMERYRYRNYLITESPHPLPLSRLKRGKDVLVRT